MIFLLSFTAYVTRPWRTVSHCFSLSFLHVHLCIHSLYLSNIISFFESFRNVLYVITLPAAYLNLFVLLGLSPLRAIVNGTALSRYCGIELGGPGFGW